ncbi:MAG: toll/interleukin-1 receptor domain-containing protein [Acidobacteria bacterium]|nr:toll/interleukin-1 receptor domain-containing protein [Acidobacteriota bacterium]
MAYQYDGFVSYAHVDNAPFEDSKEGWVTTLVSKLKVELARKLGRSDVSLWMDYQLAGNTPLTPTIMEAIRNSSTLIVVVSEAYLASEWCRREREAFLRLVRERVNAGSSVFLVECDKIERKNLPAEFGDIIGYRFWTQVREGEPAQTLGWPTLKMDDNQSVRLYFDRLNKLSYELAAEIKRQRQTVYSNLDASNTQAGPMIFLAEVTDDLDALREDVRSYLLQAGFQVAPKTWYPRDDPKTYQQAVDRDLAQCKLFVQLLSHVVGKKPPGSTIGYARLQYERARHAVKPILQWRSRELNFNGVVDEDHQQLLESDTVRACGLVEFKSAIVAEARRASLAPQPPGNNYVFVNTNSEDRRLADELSVILSSHGIWSELPIEQGDPSEIRRDLEESLSECDGIIIVYGRAPVTWVRAQLRQGRKIFGHRERPLHCLALCEVPPVPKDEIGSRAPNMITIDCGSGLNEKALLEFIERLKRKN